MYPLEDGALYLIKVTRTGEGIVARCREVKSEQYFDYPYYYGPIDKECQHREWSYTDGYEAIPLKKIEEND